MRWFLHLAAVILFVLTAVFLKWTPSGISVDDCFALGFVGLACWCASDLKGPPAS